MLTHGRSADGAPGIKRQILVLAALHLSVAAILGGPGSWNGGQRVTLPLLVGFSAAFALVGLFPVHVEVGRHAFAVTLVEAVLVVALFSLGPLAVVAAATTGEILAGVTQRRSALKLTFNAAATVGAVTVGAQAFALGGRLDPTHPGAWAVTLLAVAAYAVANHASTSAALMVADGLPFDAVFTASMTVAAVSTTVSTSLGLAAVVLHDVSPLAPVLLTPLLIAVVLATRAMTAHQTEHERFERLYVASSRTVVLQQHAPVLATLAAEAREMITGSSAMCCAPDRTGDWHGIVVDDHGSHAASPAAVAALRGVVAERGAVEIDRASVPEPVRSELSPLRTIVMASTSAGSGVPAVLAVSREVEADEHGSARAEVLAAFAGHAALTVANAGLYEAVEEALRHQIDLNRRKDDFVAVVSHELRTPLTSMLGAVATLRRIGDRMGPDDRFRLLAIAERQGQRLQRLIEDLLAVAAAEDQDVAVRMNEVDICALLDEVDRDLAIASDGRLRVEVGRGVRDVRTDEAKLRQLVSNLAENAIKYAPGSTIELRAAPAGDSLVITVTDHGPGIAVADRERVFERFVQLDQSSTRANGGTGLGLYLCRQLARLMGGTLTLGDTPGGGSSFTLTLPGALQVPPARSPSPSRAPARTAR